MESPDTNKVWNLSEIKEDKCGILTFLKSVESPQFAVFGHPIAHSLSPLMQNSALDFLRDTGKNKTLSDSKYFAFDINPEELPEALELFHKLNILGINLTIPHKVLAMDIVESAEEIAKEAGACNTLKKTISGWKGFNTDIFGIKSAVEKSLGKSFKDSIIILLGAGGAARAIAVCAKQESCKKLIIVNRSSERLEELNKAISQKNFTTQTYLAPNGFTSGAFYKEILPNSIIINATQIGLKPEDAPLLDFNSIEKSAVFFDTPYQRTRETSSVTEALKYNIKASSGLPMLAWQGARSMAIWLNNEQLVSEIGTVMERTLLKWTSL